MMASHLQKSKTGQVQIVFNWIYILIAGAVILLFFVGVVIKQKAASEERLGVDVVQVMESIFTGAGVSEKTKNSVDASGLSEYIFYFSCEGSLGEYGIKGGARVQNPVAPVFAPLELQTTHFNLWSLPYKLPYKSIDFLFVSSDNTKYFFIGESEFITEFLNETKEDEQVRFRINSQVIQTLDEAEPGENFQVRIIDADGEAMRDGLPVPSSLRGMGDTRVSAVSLSDDTVTFFQKEGSVWKKLNVNPLPIISLGGERDAARYAAVFAGNAETYQCNMNKAFRRLNYVTEVYKEKLREMQDYYEGRPRALSGPDCQGYITEYEENLRRAVEEHKSNAAQCVLEQRSCSRLILSAQALKQVNDRMSSRGDCISLY